MNFMGYNIDSPEELRQKLLAFLNISPGSGLVSIVAGANVTVDNTDPNNPIINAENGGVLPMTTGSVPPELVYLPDGSLVYFEI